ncbi:MAG: NAD(P)H-binding protein, partial [Caulobacteraceae bacterium]|nr:NAD(P)H-binding protein [Caulobacteraceae bacterium]
MSTSSRTALVLGVTGSFGGHAAAALQRRAWTIRALARDPEAARAAVGRCSGYDFVPGDAMDPGAVTAAAQGASLIVHAVNPPRYRNWKGTVLPMLEGAIAAARATGARILLPGTVYNYAPDAGEAIAEDAPQAPVTRKGAIRVEVERRLEAASAEGVRSLILRAGDFVGPAAPNSALSWMTVAVRGRLAA